MLMEGPFTIGIIENPNSLGHELQLDFTPRFRALAPADRTAAFQDYVAHLRQTAAAEIEDERERQGVLTMLQIAEQLLPHVMADELPLEETIAIEVRSEAIPLNLPSGRYH